MQFIEILTTLIILFVTINLIWVIYKKLNMKMREGLEPCTSGCVKHTGIDGDCDNKIYKEGDRYYRKCSYRCPGPNDLKYDPDQECEYNQNCESCGTFRIETDSTGYAIKKTQPQQQKNQQNRLNQQNRQNRLNQYHQLNPKNCGTMTCGVNGNEACPLCITQSLENTASNWKNEIMGGMGMSGSQSQSNSDSLTQSASNLFNEGDNRAHSEVQGLENTVSGWKNKIMGETGKYTPGSQYSGNTWRKDPTSQRTVSREEYQEMGKKFLEEESNRKGIDSPQILDSEAEVMGRMVWRVYLAEKHQKKANNSQISRQNTMERETQLINKLSQIYRTHSDSQKINPKQTPLYQSSTNVNTDNSSRMYTNQRTTGVMSSTGTYYPKQSHHLSIVHNHEISGNTLSGHPIYTDLTTAIDKCGRVEACGGVNVSSNGNYTLMTTNGHLSKKRAHTAYIKVTQKSNIDQGTSIKQSEAQLELSRSTNPSKTITASLGTSNPQARYKTGIPRDPKLAPTPYNSLMNLFS